MKDRLAFCTLGMFIIDEIEYIGENRPPQKKVIGGAGTYAALGARLAAGPQQSQYVSWIVDMGSDFPAEFKSLIESWGTSCDFRLDTSRLTTRAWNGYGPNEYRAFKYLTPKLRLDETSLTEEQVLASSFHMVCSPQRCVSLVQGIMARRRTLAPDEPRPIFVWEPVPDLCKPEELERLREAAAHVDVVSPNAEEFAAFFASRPELQDRDAAVEYLFRMTELDPLLNTALVIREGARGCTAYFSGRTLRLNAYLVPEFELEPVVDPTGAGNTFLGALAMALTGVAKPHEDNLELIDIPMSSAHKRRMLFALIHATVAAGLAIQQTGMPVLDEEDPDRWNGKSYPTNFLHYLDREKWHLLDLL